MDIAHLHPMMVHFPIVLIILGFFTELLSWFLKKEEWLPKASFILLILATLGTIAGYLTGEFFTNDLSGEAGEVKELHELLAKLTMGMMILVTLVKVFLVTLKKPDKSFQILVLVLYATGVGLVAYTGYLGGTLVINYLIGL